MDRKITLAFSFLVALTAIFAAIAALWFGPSGRLAIAPGLFEHSERVLSLFVAPLLLVVIGLAGAVGLASTRIVYAPRAELSPDAQRGLERHRHAERRLLIGVGALVAIGQLLVIFNTAGFYVPAEFVIRVSIFVFGALFASAGNMIPKIPFFSRWWQIDRAIYTQVSRFSGWAIAIAGVLVCLLAIFAPFENIRPLMAMILRSMIGLVIVNALMQVLVVAKRRT